MKRNISDIENYRSIVNRPLILDGAVGSLLQQKGINDKDLWTSKANVTESNKVIEIHKSYIKSGAEIITTNTFRTNPLAFQKSNLNYNYRDFIKQSVNLAVDAVQDKKIFIAASNSPAEDCYQLDRRLNKKVLLDNHQKHISELWNTGKVNFILNETLGHFDEIKIICEFCSLNNIPFVVSLFTMDGKTILSGESIIDTVKFVQEYNPICVSFNCIFPKIFKLILISLDLNFQNAFYLNCGSGSFEDDKIQCGISPQNYLDEINKYVNNNTVFVGSCCGSTPEHTKLLRNYFDKKNRN